jgi:uncharacterized protein YyaL (SSP411 family)
MSDPTERNRLDEAASPYLRQHADNPVNWQPWDGQALEAARERDVPIFLSVGYSACHWCHVMEEESFEDPEVAAALNEHFVPIKVDREERPDVDSVYMTVAQLVSGRGGWPLSAWLTPDGEPFYVGTYFPKEPQRGMPGFLDLLGNIHESWSDPEQREEMEGRARQWTEAAVDELESTPTPGEVPTDALLSTADSLVRGADREHGGFSNSGPKFPHPRRIHLLLEAHRRSGRDVYREVATETLSAMAEGGMYDHLGGGFHRYATDREWAVPHFEKMLYDNAELPLSYLAGYQATGAERYREVVEGTFAFVERELTHPDGGFYSTLDARSETPASRLDPGADPESEEGAFYVWTPEEVEAALDGEGAELFSARYGVTPGGNFEGTTVLTVDATHAELAAEFDLPESEVVDRLAAVRERAFETREQRPRPRRDEKVLAGWNGLMVAALAEGGRVLDDRYAERAERALSFVREHLYDPDSGRLSRRYKDRAAGDAGRTDPTVGGEGYLEDYAFLARGAFALYGVTADVDHLAFAVELARTIVEEFYDDERGTIYFTPERGEELVTRPQEPKDQSTPSSLGVAVDLLLSLDPFVPDDEFGAVAERALETYASRVESRPTEHVSLALASDRLAGGHLEVTVAADDPGGAFPELGEHFLPGLVLAPRPATDDELAEWLDALGIEEAGPIWAGREARDGPTLYVCREFTCSPPLSDVGSAVEWAEDLAPESDREGSEFDGL